MIDDFISYTGWFFGLVGSLGLAYEVYSKKKKEISYTVDSFTLVKKNKFTSPKLKLIFDDSEIENLTVTKITLWNSGNVEIQKKDIDEVEPLIISAPNTTTILDIQLEKQSAKGNMFELNKENGTVDFTYMNMNEGAVLQVYHTGPADGFALDCKIIGGSKPKNRGVSDKKTRYFPSLIYATVLPVAAACSNAVAHGLIPSPISDVLSGGFVFVLLSLFIIIKQTAFSSAIPKSLR